jgi:hypothetical protein
MVIPLENDEKCQEFIALEMAPIDQLHQTHQTYNDN